ncbi:MAG TPA: divalent-cation tolerance protein CutA [Methylophilaceae bacterium]|jgi:periplasmic divalent cation tolerance protein
MKLVITNMPNLKAAEQLAQQLIEAHAAACINILAPCTSIYKWAGKIENTQEFPMLIKTTEARYQEVQRMIREQHPYELPEIICVAVQDGLPEYLNWVENETK